MKQRVYPSHVTGTIQAPASKSYAQRAIAAALLCRGISRLSGIDLSNDTRAALDVAERLGAKISRDGEDYIIEGGLSPQSDTLNIGEAGLSARLFTPIAALWNEPITITGEGSIMTRPLDMMVDPIEQLGAKITTTNGKLPLTVQGPLRGGKITADGSLSSQFITGLLNALPLAKNDTFLKVTDLQSIPYVDMTLSVLKAFGIEIENRNYKEFHIKTPQTYRAVGYHVEGDWSGASCLLVAGAIAGEITVGNLNPDSVQADRAILEALEFAGADISWNENSVTVRKSALKAFDFDATHCPDLFPALAALAAYCPGSSSITGTNRLTHKESDRAATIAGELGKLGVNIDISRRNIMTVTGPLAYPPATEPVVVSSHNDHRIAMAAATVALGMGGEVEITQAEAVDKSYPAFWEDLSKVTQQQ